jgi:hypothetical protein
MVLLLLQPMLLLLRPAQLCCWLLSSYAGHCQLLLPLLHQLLLQLSLQLRRQPWVPR